MIKGILTASCLLLLLSISNIQPYITAVEASEKSYEAETWGVNINTASAEEIASIPGLGEKKSQAIVRFREKHGSFGRIEDLKRVIGIGDKLLEKIKPYVIVRGETTLRQH